MVHWRQLLGAFAAIFLIGRGGAIAQVQTTSQFNLSTPGARSLAMGGAFLGLADDATAAYTNPAGLTNLTVGGPEVAVEYRSWDYSTLFIEQGNLGLSGGSRPSGLGIDTVQGIRIGDSSSGARGLSFLSLGYVFPGGLTFAVYRHQLAKWRTTYATQGVFIVDDDPDGCTENCVGRFPATRTSQDLSIENYGASLAYEVFEHDKGRDSLSLGIGLSRSDFSFAQRQESFGYRDLTSVPFLDRLPGGFYGPGDFAEDNIINTAVAQGHDSAIGVNVGFLWRFGGSQRWSLGGTFRKGPKFEYQVKNALTAPRLKLSFRVPDAYGIGIAYKSRNDATKIAFDYDRVLYSQRFNDLVPANATERQSFRLADANEVHLGLEQIVMTIPSQFVGVLRLGAWYEPAHEVEFSGSDSTGRTLFPKGRDVIHWSAGLGLVVKEDYQIDAAFESSDRVNTLSFSIVRFF